MQTPNQIKMSLHEFQNRMSPILETIEKQKRKQAWLRFITGFFVGVALTFGALAIVAIQSMP